jgi:hypothetical protein
VSTSTRASSSPEGDDDPKSAPVALGLGAMVAVGSPIAAPGVVVNILGSMADDGVLRSPQQESRGDRRGDRSPRGPRGDLCNKNQVVEDGI